MTRRNIQVGDARIDARSARASGAAILLLIREDVAHDWYSLCRALGVDTKKCAHTQPDAVRLLKKLEHLAEIGLLEYDGLPDDEVPSSPKDAFFIGETDLLQDIQIALDVSLTDLVRLRGDRAMLLEPWFGPAKSYDRQTDVFVIMPFQDEMRPVYDCLSSVASQLGLTVARGDESHAPDYIANDIWDAINATRVVVADCTGKNANVFYEIGIAHTVGKPVILLAQSADDVPFDLRHIRYIHYGSDDDGLGRLESKLKQSLRETLQLSG